MSPQYHKLTAVERPPCTEWAKVAFDLPSFQGELARAVLERRAWDTWTNKMVPTVMTLIERNVEFGDAHD
jgi:hypothetical protein